MGNRDIILIHGFTNKFQDEILPIIENTPIHKQKKKKKKIQKLLALIKARTY